MIVLWFIFVALIIQSLVQMWTTIKISNINSKATGQSKESSDRLYSLQKTHLEKEEKNRLEYLPKDERIELMKYSLEMQKLRNNALELEIHKMELTDK